MIYGGYTVYSDQTGKRCASSIAVPHSSPGHSFEFKLDFESYVIC